MTESNSLITFLSSFLVALDPDDRETVRKQLDEACVNGVSGNAWREVVPETPIPPNVAHLAFCYQGKLYVLGGFDSSKHIITGHPFRSIEDATPGEKIKSSSTSCSQCGHNPDTCDFIKRFPELAYPSLNFHARCQLSSALMKLITDQYSSPILNLVLVPITLGQTALSVTCSESVSLDREGRLRKLLSYEVDLQAGDELKLKIRQMMKSQGTVPCLRLTLETGLGPNEVASLVGGTAEKNVIGPLLSLSRTLLVVSKTAQHLTIAMLVKGPVYVPCYMLVYDSELRPVFPHKDVFHANQFNILQNTHLSLADLKAHQGLSFYINAPAFTASNHEVYWGRTRLTDYLSKVFYKAPAPIQFSVQGRSVKASFMKKILRKKRPTKHKEPSKTVFTWSSAGAVEYTFQQNLLVSYKHQPRVIGEKASRAESSLVRLKLNKQNSLTP